MGSVSRRARIFLSVTHVLTKQQEEFVRSVENLVASKGYQTVTIGRNEEKSSNASRAVKESINATDGTIVIATKRVFFPRGIEFHGVDTLSDCTNRCYSSVWNQIEGAMTIQAGHPLLLMREEEVYSEGIFFPTFHPSLTFSPPGLTPGLQEAICEWLDSL
jgi:hypothetical protein